MVKERWGAVLWRMVKEKSLGRWHLSIDLTKVRKPAINTGMGRGVQAVGTKNHKDLRCIYLACSRRA